MNTMNLWESKVDIFKNDAWLKGYNASLIYSNVSYFFDKIGEGNNLISTYKGDFMPFIEPKEGFTDYWSGYYHTRPHMKGNIIEAYTKI